MNNVSLIGRLARDPEARYTENNMCIVKFTLAVSRMKKDDPADFIRCTAFGKTAETIEKFMKKGSQMALTGHIQTGSYEKDGQTVYTTDVITDRFYFVGSAKTDNSDAPDSAPADAFGGFDVVDDIPF